MNSLKSSPVYIETNNFVLRSLVEQDVNDRFLTWLNSKDMMEGLNLSGLQFTIDTLKKFVSGFDNFKHYFIGIFDRSTSVLVGFYTIDTDHKHRVGYLSAGGIGEAGYSPKKVFWATIDALLDYFYLYRGMEKMVARILRKNVRMLFCFVNNPRFEFEALLKKDCRSATGERLDIVIFSSFK